MNGQPNTLLRQVNWIQIIILEGSECRFGET